MWVLRGCVRCVVGCGHGVCGCVSGGVPAMPNTLGHVGVRVLWRGEWGGEVGVAACVRRGEGSHAGWCELTDGGGAIFHW